RLEIRALRVHRLDFGHLKINHGLCPSPMALASEPRAISRMLVAVGTRKAPARLGGARQARSAARRWIVALVGRDDPARHRDGRSALGAFAGLGIAAGA